MFHILATKSQNNFQSAAMRTGQLFGHMTPCKILDFWARSAKKNNNCEYLAQLNFHLSLLLSIYFKLILGLFTLKNVK